MPKPILIVASRSASVDRTTNSLSLFDVIDALIVNVEQGKGKGKRKGDVLHELLEIVITAIWRRSAGDEGVSFDFEFAIRTPDSNEKVLQTGTVEFTRIYHRFQFRLRMAPFTKSGEFYAESRLRRPGRKRWIRQFLSFPVWVEQDKPKSDGGNGNGKPGKRQPG